MHKSKFLIAVAILTFATATATVAAEVPGGALATTNAAAAAVSSAVTRSAKVADQNDATTAAKSKLTRAQVRAEAVKANENYRASEASSTDWFMR